MQLSIIANELETSELYVEIYFVAPRYLILRNQRIVTINYFESLFARKKY